MRGRFFAALAFAAVASLALIPWLLAVQPLLGTGLALGSFSMTVAAAYIFFLAPRPDIGLQAALVTAFASGLAWFLLPGRAAQILAILVIVGLVRSAWLYARSPARAIGVEIALAFGSVLALTLLSGPRLLSWALALWGFLLVQSLFFLVADLEPGRGQGRGENGRDAFENAHERAMRLLELTGG